MKKFFNAMSDRTSRDLDRISSNGLTRLQQAADEDDTDRIRLLVKRKADINETGLCGETALHRAVRGNNYNAARVLIELGADINLPDASGQTPLHLAVISANASTVSRLIEAGADIMATDHEGRTALHMVPNGYDEFVGMLAAQGADVNAADKQGHPPLNYHLRSPRIVQALLARGANANFSNGQPSPLVTALSIDLHTSHPAVVQQLIAAGGDVNARSTAGEPLLHLAARAGQGALFVDATAHKADPRALDANGMTVAHALAQLPQPDLLRLVLLRAPELAHTPARSGVTPLHIVLDHLVRTPTRGTDTHVTTLVEMARLLLEYGADPNVATADGTTLLHEATARNLPALIDTLAKHKVDFNLRDNKGNAALHTAIAARNIELLDRLLDHGADPDLSDDRGWTVLDRLAEKKDRESPVVQRLIVAGGQYNKQLPLYPDLIRPRKNVGRAEAANDAHPHPARERKTTPREDEQPRQANATPVKKIIKRQPPPQI